MGRMLQMTHTKPLSQVLGSQDALDQCCLSSPGLHGVIIQGLIPFPEGQRVSEDIFVKVFIFTFNMKGI